MCSVVPIGDCTNPPCGVRPHSPAVQVQTVNMKTSVIKYLLLGIVLAAVAGVEFFHEYASKDAPVCMGPQSQQELFRDLLLQHLQSH